LREGKHIIISMEKALQKDEAIRSATGFEWRVTSFQERDAIALHQKHNISEINSRLLAMRGIDLDEAADFLRPSLKAFLPDPSHLLDMDKAVERIVAAIIKKEQITIYGDYDVDGATSSALLKRFFAMIGVDVDVYIPDRLVEGYGPNAEAMKKLKKRGSDLVITVDCGAVSFEPLAAAKKAGLDVIVMDHHLGADTLPDAVAVVNPNRLDETSEHRNLAAVGVCYLFIIAINRTLRESNYYDNGTKPDILSLLDIVALGTVCDVMTLTGLNRAFVYQGLKVMANRQNLGLRVLGDVARMDGTPSVYHLGFVLGPRINAGGRIGKADLGTRLLTTNNVDEAYEIANELEKLNLERKAIETQVLDQAMEKAALLDDAGHACLIVCPDAKNYWHPGVIGIVASRVKDRFGKPCAILSIEDGVAKASARSVNGVDLGAAVVNANAANILIGGGGHAMAAGFSILEGKIPELQAYMDDQLGAKVEAYAENRALTIDLSIPLGAVSPELVQSFAALSPFGNGNPEPRFMFENIIITKAQVVGENHIMLFMKETGVGMSKRQIKAMAFRAMGTPLGDAIFSAGDRHVHIAGKVKLNNWQGVEKAEIFIDDICIV
jgi:single-stranded-DNA-specific exonuclease